MEGPQWTSHECVCIEAKQRLRLVGITTNPDGSWWLKEIPSNFSAANEKTKAQNYRNGRESNRWSTWQRPKKNEGVWCPPKVPKVPKWKDPPAFHGLGRGLSGSSPSNLLKALTGATSMNLLYYWLFLAIFILGGAWNTESLDLIEVNSVSWYLLAEYWQYVWGVSSEEKNSSEDSAWQNVERCWAVPFSRNCNQGVAWPIRKPKTGLILVFWHVGQKLI